MQTCILARDDVEFNIWQMTFGVIGKRTSFSPCKNVRNGTVCVPKSRPMTLCCSRTTTFPVINGSSPALSKLKPIQMVWYERRRSLLPTIALTNQVKGSSPPVCWSGQSRNWSYFLRVSPVRGPGIPTKEPTVLTGCDITSRL